MPIVASATSHERFDSARVELPTGWEFRFLDDFSEVGLIRGCRGADFLLVTGARPPVTVKVMDHIPSIRLIQTDGSGYDHIDLRAAAARGIPVAHVPGQNASSVAEFVLGLIIMIQRRVKRIDRLVKEGSYSDVRNEVLNLGLSELRGTSLGLIGFGRIGQEVAKLAKVFGARLSYYNRRPVARGIEEELGITYKELDELLSTSQIVSLHVPLTKETRGLIASRELALLPRDALLINTARGEIVDQAALVAALMAGTVGGAAIDTVWPEPPSPDHPLLCLSQAVQDRVIFTAHTAGMTTNARSRMLRAALANLARAWEGNRPEYIVNDGLAVDPHGR